MLLLAIIWLVASVIQTARAIRGGWIDEAAGVLWGLSIPLSISLIQALI